MRSSMKKLLTVAILLLILLTGCSIFHKHPEPLAVYDLAVQPHHIVKQKTHLQKKSILINDASAPSWLDNTAIYYRLAYHNPAQLHRYANSRWIASPNVMLTQRMRDQIADNTGSQIIKNNHTAKAEYSVHIELEEFIQIFDSTQRSHGSIALRASLIRHSTRNLIAQNYFSTQVAAPTSDASGAVIALSNASDELINKIIEWMLVELPASSLH